MVILNSDKDVMLVKVKEKNKEEINLKGKAEVKIREKYRSYKAQTLINDTDNKGNFFNGYMWPEER